MTYSTTLTTSQTFTIADAKYLASRIATDLGLLRIYYGGLTAGDVENLTLEAAILLKFGLLEHVKYGYRKGGSWAYFVSYSVNYLGQLEVTNDSPGAIDSQANVTGATWYSLLTRRNNSNLSAEEIANINQLIPIQRSVGVVPNFANGTLNADKTYYRNGTDMSRSQYRSN